MITQEKQVLNLDFCLPDFFSGYHRPIICVFVYEAMTAEEVGEAIKDEVNYLWDYLTSGDDGYNESEIKLIDTFADELINRGSEIVAEPEEVPEGMEGDEIEWPCLYFGIGSPKMMNGLMFCD